MKPFHLHRWIPIGVDPCERVVVNPQTYEELAVTDVKKRYQCGKVRTRELAGKWTLGELTDNTLAGGGM